jgi:glycosyltransferase involved in cell wall biosynthesis
MINFIGSINDGSLKIGEIHFCRENYRDFKLEKLPGFAKKIFKYLWMRQLISNIRKLDKFVVLTNEDKQKWNEIDQNKIMTIYNPVSSSSQQFSSCENKRVIAAGRYSLEKGFDLLTEAWKYVNEKHPDWTLHIYGDGDRTDLEKRINRLKLTNSFIANGKTNAITEKYLESSIFVLSSRWEGMPLVLIEAMSLGVAPVSFACPSGPRDIITHGIDGLLVENGNIEMLAENICYLIENEEKRKEMGRNARESVKRFDAKVIMSQWKELFEMLIIEKS